MTDFWQEKKAIKTQRNFRSSDLEKILSTLLQEIFLKNPFKRFQNFSQTIKLSSKKIQGKILKEGFQNLPRAPLKKNAPFPKVF